MRLVLLEQKKKNAMAREFYLENRNRFSSKINLVKKAGLKPAEIVSDMALFREESAGRVQNFYYDRIEIKTGKTLLVLPLR